MKFYEIENDFIKIYLNPKLYNLETIYSSAYQLMETVNIILEGDPDVEVIVNLSYKEKDNTEKELTELAKEFSNKLINYSYYKINTKNKALLRSLLLKKSFENIILEDIGDDEESENQTKDENCTDCKEDTSEIDTSVFEDEDDVDEEDFEFDDPEGIAIPWEEKYGDELNSKTESSKDDKSVNVEDEPKNKEVKEKGENNEN